jgi:lipoprotein NlpI
MITRVFAHMKKGEPAMKYGKMMLELAKKAEKEDKDKWASFDMPFVYEAMAKAYAVAGKKDDCANYKKMAQDLTDKLEDKQDQEICQGEIDKISC